MYWPPPPYYGPPVMYPPMQPPQQGQPVNMSLKDINKAIRLHQKMIEQYEAEKKKKDEGKKKDEQKKGSGLNALQWCSLLIMTSPLLGLVYLKVLSSIAQSIPH